MADPQSPSQHEVLGTLTDAEIDAIVSAATWYASYKQADIRAKWDDMSAAESIRRQKFLALHEGLRKLGVRRASPAPPTEVVRI